MKFTRAFILLGLLLNIVTTRGHASESYETNESFEQMGMDDSFDSDQYVHFYTHRISARGTGAFSETATGRREVAYARELSSFNDSCRTDVAKAGWTHHIKEVRKPSTYLDENNKVWISYDAGYLYCYGITH